jgi:acyl-CoA synthetase (NDP forming)
MAHRLDPLLRPRAVALLGASSRPGSVGNVLLRQALHGGFGGALYPINPRYQRIEGVPCYPSFDTLPGPVEHAVIALGDERVEVAFEAALDHGARAVTIFSSLFLTEDAIPPLAERIRARAREAGVLVCGPMSMGFYNFAHRLWVCGFDTRLDHRSGSVSLITQSGSVMSSLVDAEARIDYNLVVSSGQELVVSAADYLDFALDMPSTRVVALFLEAIRDPEGFVRCLQNANARGIPVIALKVGRTERSARFAASHSGALVGNDGAYRALFERHGVLRVASLDEMAHTIMLFAQPHAPGPGGLATIHDSGGERSLLVDLAADAGVPLAELSGPTLEALAARLDPGLPPGNPLDAWGTGRDYRGIFGDCFNTLMRDPATALGAVVCDRGPEGRIFPEYLEFTRAAHAASGKPTCLVSNHQGSGGSADAISLTREGFPVLDGVAQFLKGVRHLFDYRDFRERAAPAPCLLDEAVLTEWRPRLTPGTGVDAARALAWLEAFGVPVVAHGCAATRADALAAAAALGYPVALKTAEPGIVHKTDAGGVRLDLGDAGALARAYDDVAARLGPRVLVTRMERGGVEVMLGMANDSQFGPVILMGAGGIHAELLEDVVCALPPLDAPAARRLLARLRVWRLLQGVRGAAPAAVDALCVAAARLSALAVAFADQIQSIDVNPVLVRPDGCVAVDARVILHGA